MRLQLAVFCTIFWFIGFICAGCNNETGTENNNRIDWGDKDSDCNLINEINYHILSEASENRAFLLHLPAGYDGTENLPVIINYHGFGGCASYYQSEVGDLNQIADANNFIVVYPQASEGPKGDVYWEPADDGSNSILQSDVYFTERLISYLSSNYSVDLNKVYAVGYSNGGMMAYGLACARPDIIAAVGIMSGVMLPQDCGTNLQSSIIHFHGIDDGVLPYEGNNDYQSIQQVIDFWVAHNALNFNMSVRILDANVTDVIHDVYGNFTDHTSVQLYTINKIEGKPGDHVWFTGEIGGQKCNQILWDFLSQYSLDD